MLGVTFLGYSQNIEKNKNSKTSKNQEKNKILPIIITGTTDDPKGFKTLNLHFDAKSELLPYNFYDKVNRINDDSIYLKIDSVKQSGIMKISAFGDSAKYRQTIFVTPGDKISLKIKNKKLEIIGKNQQHYDFFKELNSLKRGFQDIKYDGNINQYKQECKEIYDRHLNLFNQYIDSNNQVSNEFVTMVEAYLKFQYLNELMWIYKKGSSKVKTIIEILNEDFYQNNESIFDIEDYFDGISIEDLKKPEFLTITQFKTFSSGYVNVFLVDPNIDNYSNDKFRKEKEFILSNFKGEMQHFLIARMIYYYNYFAQSENVYNLKELIKDFKHKFTNQSYINQAEEVEQKLLLLKTSIPEIALNAKMLSLEGDTLTVNQVFKLTNSSIKAIDFWASWCGPCINEIMIGDEKRKEISDNNNLVWIYLSIDNDKDAWIKKSNELVEYGLTRNQYLILDVKNSELTKFFEINQIPRYVILDKNGLIVNRNAARPSYENHFQKIIDEIK